MELQFNWKLIDDDSLCVGYADTPIGRCALMTYGTMNGISAEIVDTGSPVIMKHWQEPKIEDRNIAIELCEAAIKADIEERIASIRDMDIYIPSISSDHTYGNESPDFEAGFNIGAERAILTHISELLFRTEVVTYTDTIPLPWWGTNLILIYDDGSTMSYHVVSEPGNHTLAGNHWEDCMGNILTPGDLLQTWPNKIPVEYIFINPFRKRL